MTVVQQEFCDIETDTASADNRDTFTHGHAIAKHIDIAEHFGVILSFDLRVSWCHARSDDDFVVILGCQRFRGNAIVQLDSHAQQFDLPREVLEHLVKLFLAGNDLGHIQLAADFSGCLVQINVVATLGQHHRCRESGGP